MDLTGNTLHNISILYQLIRLGQKILFFYWNQKQFNLYLVF